MPKKIILNSCAECQHFKVFGDRFGEEENRCRKLRKSVNPVSIDKDCPLEDN
jgi:hypothetical protein